MRFCINQHRRKTSGVEKSASEYYWGRQRYSKNVELYQQVVLHESSQLVEQGIIDKMKYQILVVLNEDLNRNDLKRLLASQKELLMVLQ